MLGSKRPGIVPVHATAQRCNLQRAISTEADSFLYRVATGPARNNRARVRFLYLAALARQPSTAASDWCWGVYGLIEGVVEVDHVERIVLRTGGGSGNGERIQVPDRNLVYFDKERSLIELRTPV